MKSKVKQILAIVLAVVLLASLSACGSKDVNNNEINGTFSEFLVAEKVGTVDRDNFTTNDGGLTYKGDNDLYGIISYEGLHDSGAIYSSITSKGKYFQVRKAEPTSRDDIAALNSSCLVDGKGNIIVPISENAMATL